MRTASAKETFPAGTYAEMIWDAVQIIIHAALTSNAVEIPLHAVHMALTNVQIWAVHIIAIALAGSLAARVLMKDLADHILAAAGTANSRFALEVMIVLSKMIALENAPGLKNAAESWLLAILTANNFLARHIAVHGQAAVKEI